MRDLGTPSVPSTSSRGKVQVYFLDELDERIDEEMAHGRNKIMPATLRLVREALKRHESVTLLSRRKTGFPWNGGGPLNDFYTNVTGYFPEEEQERIKASTVHKYKGREDDCVILLDAVDRSYPLIHPSWIYQRIFGDEPSRLFNDERRLFYVAVTRSRNSLMIISESEQETPFLDPVRGGGMATRGDWSALESVATTSGTTFELRAFKAYEHKELLKADGFEWIGHRKYWRSLVDETYVSESTWLSKPWFKRPLELEILNSRGRSVQKLTAREAS